VAQPWSTIAENEETGALSFEMHIPTTEGDLLIVWSESSVRELHGQLEEFLTLVEQRQIMEAIVAMDSGGN
jgi:hypothetical protein